MRAHCKFMQWQSFTLSWFAPRLRHPSSPNIVWLELEKLSEHGTTRFMLFFLSD